jgi:hypothetical protein
VTIVNNGVLPIRNVSLDIYVEHAKANDVTVQDSGGSNFQPPTGILRPGEPITTNLAHMISGSGIIYSKLDIALIAKFSPIWAPFWRRARVYRFRNDKGAAGISILEQVPAENIEEDYWRTYNRFHGRRPPENSN